MTHISPLDVLIVGAGPVGMTLAIDLARRGIACRVIDQNVACALGTRARGVNARTQEIFEDLGVLERLSAYCEPRVPWRFLSRDGQLISETTSPVLAPTPDKPYPGNVIIGQQNTEAVLRQRLEDYGLAVELNSRLVSFTQGEQGVRAQVQHEEEAEEIQARYLIGCDGGSSSVRKLAGISFLGKTHEEEYVMFGNLDVSGLDPAYWYFWVDERAGLLVTLNPMPRSQTWFFTASIQPDEHGLLPPPTLETFTRTFHERVSSQGIAFSDPLYLSTYRLNIRMVSQYRRGRVLLAGDAAHVHAPAGGQGMNTGVQDAYNLGWKLAAVLRGAPDALLDTYESERLPVARGVLASSTARIQSWSASSTTGANQIAQNMAKVSQGTDPFSDVTQLSVTYRGSSLSRDLREVSSVRAGDRAPDTSCLRSADGSLTRLFNLFQGTHFTLLAFSDHPFAEDLHADHDLLHVYTIARASTESALRDAAGHAYQAYGVSQNALILVRPDGYIGLTAGLQDGQAIRAYLREITGR